MDSRVAENPSTRALAKTLMAPAVGGVMGHAVGPAGMPAAVPGPLKPPPAKKMPRSAFRATVGAPPSSLVYGLVRDPKVSYLKVLKTVPRGGTAWLVALAGPEKGTRRTSFQLALLNKQGAAWRLEWLFSLDAPAKSFPLKRVTPAVKLVVKDYDWDGKPEVLVRYRYAEKSVGGGCARWKMALVNLDGPAPKIAVMALLEADCPLVQDRVQSVVYHRDLNKDGHPDLQVALITDSRGPASVGQNIHSFVLSRIVTRKEVPYTWDWRTDTYQQGATKTKSYEQREDE